jgi:Ca2+-binding EF-hand superfamily protein
MKKLLGTITVTGLLGVAGTAAAETAPILQPSLPRFAAADTDTDGSIAREELLLEVSRRVRLQVSQRFGKLDRNHDGRVARREVPSMDAARFARFDVNRDGAFTARELELVMRLQVSERVNELFAQLDLDRDGRFSQAELAVPTESAVAKADQTPRTAPLVAAKRTTQAKF